MGVLEVPTTRSPSKIQPSTRGVRSSSLMANGFGRTQHIRHVCNHLFHAILTPHQLGDWVTAPYKRPEALEPEKEEFNNHVSMLRIRSEHAIGFLKGRFHSLKHLRVN